MKKHMRVYYMVVLILFLSVSCQTSEPMKMSPDYDLGKQLAETYAKEDAKKLQCMLYRRKAWQSIMSGQLKEHTAALKNEKTEEFLNGFIEGYRKYYAEYADTYCGE